MGYPAIDLPSTNLHLSMHHAFKLREIAEKEGDAYKAEVVVADMKEGTGQDSSPKSLGSSLPELSVSLSLSCYYSLIGQTGRHRWD